MVVFQPPVLSHGFLTYDKAAGNHCLDILKALDHDLDGNLHLDLDGNLHLDLDGNLHLDLDGNLHLDLDGNLHLDLDGNLHLDLHGNLHLDLDGNLHLDLYGNLHLLHNECALNDEVSSGRDPLVAESDGGLACARIKATQ